MTSCDTQSRGGKSELFPSTLRDRGRIFISGTRYLDLASAEEARKEEHALPTEKTSVSIYISSVFFPFQWKDTDNGQLMDSKLKCVFVLPNDDGGSAAGVAAAASATSAGSGGGSAAGADPSNAKSDSNFGVSASAKVRVGRFWHFFG